MVAETAATSPVVPDWEDLYAQIRACTRCALCQTRNQAVPGHGAFNARIMFVGEAPGASEDRDGVPFVGQAGKFLTELLTGIGIDRSDVYIANVLKCRPPQNRDPLPQEIQQCLPYLRKQVAWMRPQVICTLGKFSLRALIDPAANITQAHGKFFPKGSFMFFATYHPAAALYSNALKPVMQEDFRKLGAFLREQALHPSSSSAAAAPAQATANGV